MTVQELDFERPEHLQASQPAEREGKPRDGVRLLVSQLHHHQHSRFTDLPNHLRAGDVLVVNDSATLPASLSAVGSIGPFLLNLSSKYSDHLWLAEPRLSASHPGPLPLREGELLEIAGTKARLVCQHPALPRLWFVHVDTPIDRVLHHYGSPIRYGYVNETYPLESYQTIFAKKPGSAEMPSAARPFTKRVLDDLIQKGIEIASITLHTGVSSLEIETDDLEAHQLYAEPFEVSEQTATKVNEAKAEGRRVIAVGTTVVRALESAWKGRLRGVKGFTSRYIRPGASANLIDGLLTGFHDPKASHLAMLYAVAGKNLIQEGYKEAVDKGYLWHEFGDSHLILV